MPPHRPIPESFRHAGTPASALHDHAHGLARRLQANRLSRRDTLWLFGAAVGASALSGCATSPVTGERILVGMSESDERAVDRRQAPHQFSADMGAVQDAGVNAYVSGVGRRLQAGVHRPDMPYSYRVLNANYVNAYTFPAGAMGVTRGILVDLQDESELAALLGHELGHVNARHSAQRQGQALVAQAAIATVSVATSDSRWSPLVGIGSQIGASALLASYSRDNEREADALGQGYLVRAGYPASGMVRLHQLLMDEHQRQPSMLETLFATHPMAPERREAAQRLADSTYAASRNAPGGREAFMDNTATMRRLKPTIEACKQGETALSRKALPDAQRQFDAALRLSPRDYPSLLRMSQTFQAQGRLADARRYAESAREVYPQEAQAVKQLASLKMGLREPEGALRDLETFDRMLPGDPGTGFLKGVALEAMGRREAAAQEYRRFLAVTQQGQAAGYASQRLKAWGYAR